MCNLMAVLESKCSGCEFNRKLGCNRINYLKKRDKFRCMSYNTDVELIGILSGEGLVIDRKYIKWCDKWSNNE